MFRVLPGQKGYGGGVFPLHGGVGVGVWGAGGGQATVALLPVWVSVRMAVSVRSCRGLCGVVRWIRRRLVVIWRRFPNRRRGWWLPFEPSRRGFTEDGCSYTLSPRCRRVVLVTMPTTIALSARPRQPFFATTDPSETVLYDLKPQVSELTISTRPPNPPNSGQTKPVQTQNQHTQPAILTSHLWPPSLAGFTPAKCREATDPNQGFTSPDPHPTRRAAKAPATDTESISPPHAAPYKTEHPAPSERTPAPGTKPPSPDPHPDPAHTNPHTM